MADAKPDLDQNDMFCGDVGTDPKKRRIEENADSINHTKITDVNQLCLELIFIHLDLEDLLSVANANKQLKYATYMPFAHNYAGKSIGVELHKKYNEQIRDKKLIIKNEYDCILNEKEITIFDLKTTFQMLRCFGGMVTELGLISVHYFHNNNLQIFHRIMSYIYEFCTDSLKNVTFSKALGFEEIKKPFLNVEDLTIINLSDLKEKCLSRAFPKVRRLQIKYCENEDLSILFENFPNLCHFRLRFRKPVAKCSKCVAI